MQGGIYQRSLIFALIFCVQNQSKLISERKNVMKKTKLISLFLAVIMLFTCFTAAFPAFASDSDVKNAQTLIDAVKGKINAENARPQAVEKYEKALQAFNALSDSERDNFDVVSFGKLLNAVYSREIYLWKVENNSTGTTNAKKAVHERALKALKMPSFVEEAISLYTAASSIKDAKDVDSFLTLLKSSSSNSIVLAGCYNKTYKYFDKKAGDKDGGKLLDLAAEKISAVTMNADKANKPVQPKSVSKPNAKKYPGGETDPGYIADYKKYLDYKKAFVEYTADRYKFEAEKHYFSALKAMAEANAEAECAYKAAVLSLETMRGFSQTGNIKAADSFLEFYNRLSDAQKTWLDALDNYAYAELKVTDESSIGKEYGTNNYRVSDMVAFCAELDRFPALAEFEAVVEGLPAPYTNADIDVAKKAYKAVPAPFTGYISAKTNEKYKAILASADKDVPSAEEPDLGEYKTTEVSYKNISEDDASMLADVLVDLVLNAAGVSNAEELVSTKVLTNKTVVSLAGWLFPMLEELTNGFVFITPDSLSNNLKEEQFAGAAAALKAAYNDWESIKIKSGDFGFEDGDAEGFLDAAAAMLRGASLLHSGISLENKKNASKGIYYGGYEDLIEIFEILDLSGIMTSEEYTAYVKEAENTSDAKFRAILVPVVKLLVDFGKDPVGVINDVLPKVAYAIDSGIVDTNINSLIDKFSLFGLTIPNVDLSTAGLYGILNSKFLTPKGIKLSEETFSELIEKLSGCGKAVSKPSQQSDKEYRLAIESDKAKSAVVLITFVLDTAAANHELVSSLLDMANINPLLKVALTLAISASATFIPRRVIFPLISLFVYLARIFAIFM